MKKKTKRSQTKYAALKPHLNLKSRIDLLDYDYLDKLTPEEKEWLNRFTEEYTHANLKHGGKKLHKTEKLKKDVYSRNNKRNNDIYTLQKSKHLLAEMKDLSFEHEKVDIEDKIIEQLDLHKFEQFGKRNKNTNNNGNNS